MNCERVAEIEDSYLLGELDETEMQDVERHLKTCANCDRRISEHEELLGRMFASLEPVAPAAYNRTAVLDKVQAQTPKPLPKKLRGQISGGWRVIYGTLAAALVLGLSIWAVALNIQLHDTSSREAESESLFQLTGSPDSRIWLMTPPDVPFDATAPRARMYVLPGSDQYLVTATNLKPAPDGQVYRVWYEHSQKTEYAGWLQLDKKGQASLRVKGSGDSSDEITKCYITIEQAGSPTNGPGSQPFLLWKRD
jgi:anti-sigma-K factor RskA